VLVPDTPQLVIPPAAQPKDPDAKVPTPDMFLIGIGNAVPDEPIGESDNPRSVGKGPSINKIYYYINQ
jgi:type IV pilus assembly protein PilY1